MMDSKITEGKKRGKAMVTIKEAAERFNISTHTIRFYEKEGLLKIPRNDRGIRDFDEKSMDAIKAIVHYRNVGMSLEDIRQVFTNYHNHELSLQLLKETKKELDAKIAELEATREYLVYKIGLHQAIVNKEKNEGGQ